LRYVNFENIAVLTHDEVTRFDGSVRPNPNPNPKKTARIRITAAQVVGEYFSGRERTTRSDEHWPYVADPWLRLQ